MIAGLLGLLVAQVGASAPQKRGVCPKTRTALVHNRQDTWKAQDSLGLKRTRASIHRPAGCAYVRWVRDLWKQRAERLVEAAQDRQSLVKVLNHGLARTPMRGTGKELEAAARRRHIHPAFIAAIAATESSFGAAACGNFNAYGLGNCSGIWNVPAFRSWGESYRFMARFLTERWPNARSAYEYPGYAACTSCWGRAVAKWMRWLGFSAETTYP